LSLELSWRVSLSHLIVYRVRFCVVTYLDETLPKFLSFIELDTFQGLSSLGVVKHTEFEHLSRLKLIEFEHF
jgi:hypothetical protein